MFDLQNERQDHRVQRSQCHIRWRISTSKNVVITHFRSRSHRFRDINISNFFLESVAQVDNVQHLNGAIQWQNIIFYEHHVTYYGWFAIVNASHFGLPRDT